MRSAVVVLAAMLAGCTPSWEPLYTASDNVLDPALPGLWRAVKEERDGSRDYFVVSHGKGAEYRVVHCESNGAAGVFTARLVDLGRYRFVDLFPEEPPIAEGFYSGHLARTHTFWRVTLQGDRLRLGALDPDWFKAEAGRKSSLPLLMRDGEPLLVAPTAKLREFAERFAASEAFSTTSEWIREK